MPDEKTYLKGDEVFIELSKCPCSPFLEQELRTLPDADKRPSNYWLV